MLACHFVSFAEIFQKLDVGALGSYLITLLYLGDFWNSFVYCCLFFALRSCLVAGLLSGIPLIDKHHTSKKDACFKKCALELLWRTSIYVGSRISELGWG